jgi:hypothetical protein
MRILLTPVQSGRQWPVGVPRVTLNTGTVGRPHPVAGQRRAALPADSPRGTPPFSLGPWIAARS